MGGTLGNVSVTARVVSKYFPQILLFCMSLQHNAVSCLKYLNDMYKPDQVVLGSFEL